nr:MAG TPA: hypothetical protein [Caudoviricetes sp.]
MIAYIKKYMNISRQFPKVPLLFPAFLRLFI